MIQRLDAEHGDEDVIHRYVAGTLSPAETVPFEVHLLTCVVCQHAVREGAALRAALGQPGVAAVAS